MPYLGRTPAGAAGNVITGDLKVTGVLSADSISNNIVLDSTDGSANENDNVVMNGTDSDSTNADDNLLCEENTGDMLVEKRIPTAFGTDGQVFTSTGSTQSAFEDAPADYVKVGSTVLTTTASSIDFLLLDTTTYKHFVFYIYAVLSTTAILHARLNNTGGSLETGSTAYRWGANDTYIGAAAKNDQTAGDEADDRIDVGIYAPMANAPLIGEFWLFNPDIAADRTFFRYFVNAAPNTTYFYMSDGGGRMDAVGAHNVISFYPASGTFIAGDMIQAYGVKV